MASGSVPDEFAVIVRQMFRLGLVDPIEVTLGCDDRRITAKDLANFVNQRLASRRSKNFSLEDLPPEFLSRIQILIPRIDRSCRKIAEEVFSHPYYAVDPEKVVDKLEARFENTRKKGEIDNPNAVATKLFKELLDDDPDDDGWLK